MSALHRVRGCTILLLRHRKPSLRASACQSNVAFHTRSSPVEVVPAIICNTSTHTACLKRAWRMPAGETAEGWQSGEGRTALQQRLQSIVDDYREADVAAAIERRRREQRRVAAAHGGDDGGETDGMDEQTDDQEEEDADGTPSIGSDYLYLCYRTATG